MLKLVVVVVVVVVCFGLILIDICFFGWQECFLNLIKFKSNLVDFFEWLFFLEDIVIDKDENVFELLKGLNYYVWENNCVKIIEIICNFLVFLKVLDRR